MDKTVIPNRNYQKEMEKTLAQVKDGATLLLHSCCAPCSSYVLEYLSKIFEITLFFYNPNISSEEEYDKRFLELNRFVNSFPHEKPIHIIKGMYEPDRFYEIAKGLENVKEGGSRCYACYKLRLEETAKLAKEKKFDYFTTTLSISPLKNAHWLNEIGLELSKEVEINYLVSDFKKKGGYQRSIVLSKEYDLYRQNFCGCIYSMRSSEDKHL